MKKKVDKKWIYDKELVRFIKYHQPSDKMTVVYPANHQQEIFNFSEREPIWIGKGRGRKFKEWQKPLFEEICWEDMKDFEDVAEWPSSLSYQKIREDEAAEANKAVEETKTETPAKKKQKTSK